MAMFADRLRNYVFVNNEKRRRDDRVSLLIAFGAYFYLAVIIDLPEAKAAIGALVVLGTSMLWFAIRYSVSATQATAVRQGVGLLYRPVSRRLVLASVFAMVLVVGLPQVEAATIDRKLRALTRSTPLSPDDAKQITHNLEIAERLNIQLPPQTLIRVRDTIKESALQDQQVEPLAKSADALVSYDRRNTRVAETLIGISPSVLDEFHRGLMHSYTGQAKANLADLTLSLQELTEAIRQGNGNPRFQAMALMTRAMTNTYLGNNGAALADVRAAEALGSLSIPEISLTEGMVFSNETDPQALRRGVSLLTFALQLNVDESLNPPLYRLAAHSARCAAYFRLGEYQNAAADAQDLIKVERNKTILGIAYKVTILSYLGMHNYEEALEAADEFRKRVGDPTAERWLETVRLYPQDPQGVWNTLYQDFMGHTLYQEFMEHNK
jgi:tetratricopeptide (TPR) repeat protein